VVLFSFPAGAEDGHDLWLRYRLLEPSLAAQYQLRVTALVGEAGSPTLQAAQDELQRGLKGMLGAAPDSHKTVKAGAVVFGTPRSSPTIAGLQLDLSAAGEE